MKKMIAGALSLCLLLSCICVCYAAVDRELPLASIAGKTDSLNVGASVAPTRGQYIMFKGVDFTGVKSVQMTGTSKWNSGWNSDMFALRLDNVKGEIVGYIDFDDESKTTFGTNVNVSGVHDLYIVSSYAVSGAVTFTKVELSSQAWPEKEAYVPAPDSAVVDNYSDTWTAVSGLGRSVADYEEVGDVKEGKQVGLFYWDWNVNWDQSDTVINNTTFQVEHPSAYKEDGYFDPAWPKGSFTCFWDEPLFGYYAGNDYWPYRKDAELLGDIGVDFIYLDCTNGTGIFRRNFSVLCKAFEDAKKAGGNAPKIVITSNLSQPVQNTYVMLEYLYKTFYEKGLYSDLWYYWQGKPLILAHEESLDKFVDKNDPEDVELIDNIKNFFTFRGCTGNWKKDQQLAPNKWTIVEKYPQRTFGKTADGKDEMVIAMAACNSSIETEALTPMSTETARGKNYTEVFGHDYSKDAFQYNYFFEEQIAGALDTDAIVLSVSSWNESTVGRQQNYNNKFPNCFVDHFDAENTRDLGLSKGKNRDNGYMLLADAIRKWKGVRPAPTASAEKTINIASGANQWSDVGPNFINTKGVYQRDAKGYGSYYYKNDTARNNITKAKVARDSENLWFYAETQAGLTPSTDAKWMRLYINSDRNYATGWEGYDFRINGSKAGSVEKWENGAWKSIGMVDFNASGNVLQIKVPRNLLGTTGKVNFEFKWVDNADDSDLLNFYVDGITAPTGRFNYLYTEIKQVSLSAEAREALKGTTIVKTGTNKAIIKGAKMNVYESDTRYGVRELNGTAYIPAAMLKDAIRYGTTKITFESDRSFLKVDTEKGMAYTTIGTKAAVFEGKDVALTNPAALIDGVPYVPVSFMSDIFGYTVKNLGGGVYIFGDKVNEEAAKSAANML
ncbi:MAG: stalk domain-containing protein [Bacillota bacterium]|nr:stalk domain-containing protein [Bacillota bacterium]